VEHRHGRRRALGHRGAALTGAPPTGDPPGSPWAAGPAGNSSKRVHAMSTCRHPPAKHLRRTTTTPDATLVTPSRRRPCPPAAPPAQPWRWLPGQPSGTSQVDNTHLYLAIRRAAGAGWIGRRRRSNNRAAGSGRHHVETVQSIGKPGGPKAADNVGGQAWGASSECHAGSVDPSRPLARAGTIRRVLRRRTYVQTRARIRPVHRAGRRASGSEVRHSAAGPAR